VKLLSFVLSRLVIAKTCRGRERELLDDGVVDTALAASADPDRSCRFVALLPANDKWAQHCIGLVLSIGSLSGFEAMNQEVAYKLV
jgi:hypothetical protein